jgi:hypothetical protein
LAFESEKGVKTIVNAIFDGLGLPNDGIEHLLQNGAYHQHKHGRQENITQ